MLDYEILRIIWWVLVVVLLIGFSVTDGFDMGVTALLPVAGKKEVEKRIMINSIAPHWDGNQVWLLTAGGAIFAAWPIVYSVAFSGFILPRSTQATLTVAFDNTTVSRTNRCSKRIVAPFTAVISVSTIR